MKTNHFISLTMSCLTAQPLPLCTVTLMIFTIWKRSCYYLLSSLRTCCFLFLDHPCFLPLLFHPCPDLAHFYSGSGLRLTDSKSAWFLKSGAHVPFWSPLMATSHHYPSKYTLHSGRHGGSNCAKYPIPVPVISC